MAQSHSQKTETLRSTSQLTQLTTGFNRFLAAGDLSESPPITRPPPTVRFPCNNVQYHHHLLITSVLPLAAQHCLGQQLRTSGAFSSAINNTHTKQWQLIKLRSIAQYNAINPPSDPLSWIYFQRALEHDTRRRPLPSNFLSDSHRFFLRLSCVCFYYEILRWCFVFFSW